MIVIHQPSYSGTRKLLIIGVAGFILTCQILLANNLLNIDFGVGTASQKQGPAAIGNSPTDFWNHYSRDDGSGGFRTYGEVFDLVWADGSVSTADLTVVNAPGAWGNQSQDPMLGVYLYPGSGENITVSIGDLPVGNYALYVYAHGASDDENGDVQARVGDVDHGAKVTNVTAGWQTLPWQEGVQYVRFQGLTVSANEPLIITVRPGTTGLAVINGMQLLRLSDCSPPSGLVGWWPGEGNGTDVVGGNDGELVNGLDFANGLVGQAFNFDAPGEHLVAPTPEDFAADSFTLETWINPDPARLAEQQPIFEFAEATSPAGAHFWLSVVDGAGAESAGALFANVRSVDGENHFLGTPAGRVVGGEWSHVAMTYDSSSGIGSLYLNGSLEVSRTLGSFEPQTGQPLYIGYRSQDSPEGGAGFTFGGKIDEPSFYARALSAAEIASIHAAGSDGKCGSPWDCVPVADGLVAWWAGEGDAADEVGSHPGQMLGNPEFAVGRVGQGLAFDGIDDAVRIEYSSDLIHSELTVEAWVKPLSLIEDPDYDQDLLFGQAFGYPQLVARNGSDGIRVSLSLAEDPATFMVLEGTEEIPVGEFSHVAATWDGTTMKLYVNGSPAGILTPGRVPTATTCPFFIGGWQDACGFTGGFFHGVIDELSFYGRALSNSEIAAIHAAGSNGKCGSPAPCVSAPPDLLAWWPGEGDGTDVAGGNDGKLVNGLDFANGLVGQAFNFDASGEHLVAPALVDFAAGSFTLETWINPDPARLGEQLPILEFAESTGPAGAHLWLSVLDGAGAASEGALFGNVRSVDGENHFLGTPPGRVAGGEWSHVAMTYDSLSGIGSLYLNGILEVSRELGSFEPQTGQPLYIGYRPQDSSDGVAGFTFGGKIDEPSLYARALSASEIAAIHAAGSNGKCVPQGYTLTVGTTPGGTVLRDPDAPRYQPGDTVTLTALPEAGFVFDHWQGDAFGTEPEVTLLMDGPKQVMAVFVDVAPPVIEIQSPITGVTELSTFVLSGTVTDNLAVGSANWEWNGQPLGFLPLTSGQFYVEGLQWVLGENRIRVVAVDIAGNEASTEIVVEWVPARLLSVIDPDPRQEGQRIHVTIQLSSSGDVGGASFVLRYDPAYLKQPGLDWSQSVQSALNQVNTDIPGEVRATFALPATAVPAGTRNLAVVTFRARSVPETLTTGLQLQLLDVSDPSGDSIVSGSAVRPGLATILVRRVVGDNNANHRLDVGDATLIQRLLTGIDPVRFWDGTGNDVNENTLLDSGDVIRVLRAVVGLDPQPLPDGGVTAGIGLARENVAPMGDETAGAILLEADKQRAAPGELVTVRIRFAEVASPIAAVALNLEYPVQALRLLNPQSHRLGDLVPATTVAVWNVAPAQNDYTLQTGAVTVAMSSALSWPSSAGVAAEFTFQVQEGQTAHHQWPIRVSQAEISADGYDMTPLSDATVYFVGRDPLPAQLTSVSANLGEDGFAFSFMGEAGVEYVLEVSRDLTEWVPLGTRTGANEPITISDPAALGAEYRFYRVRFE